jgi:hypothetical protein
MGISFQLRAPSVERKTPLWCCAQKLSAAPAHWTTQCESCAPGSSRFSGGMYAANIPREATDQDSPPSSVSHAPPQETPASTRCALRGSTQME